MSGRQQGELNEIRPATSESSGRLSAGTRRHSVVGETVAQPGARPAWLLELDDAAAGHGENQAGVRRPGCGDGNHDDSGGEAGDVEEGVEAECGARSTLHRPDPLDRGIGERERGDRCTQVGRGQADERFTQVLSSRRISCRRVVGPTFECEAEDGMGAASRRPPADSLADPGSGEEQAWVSQPQMGTLVGDDRVDLR